MEKTNSSSQEHRFVMSKEKATKPNIFTWSRITEREAQKYLSQVPEPNVFWCNDGSVFRDIKELKEALAIMSDHTFSYHCNDSKRDFSNWIRDIVGDEKLAKNLESVSGRQQAFKVVEERCSLLVSKAG
jgi:hypothetical protein